MSVVDRAGEPVQSGTFIQAPFSHLLIAALDERFTGAIEIEDGQALHVVQLDRGYPCRVLCSDGLALLGALLVERGIASAEDIEIGLRLPPPLGQALVRQGLIDEPTLGQILALQVLLRTMRIFALPRAAQWRWIEGDARFGPMPPACPIDTTRALWAGIEAYGDDPARMDETLGALGDAPLELRDGARLERFGFSGPALAVATQLVSEEPSLTALVAAEPAPRELCRRVVYALCLTRFIAPRDQGAGELPKPISSRPSESSDEVPASSQQAIGRIALKRVAKARNDARESSPDPAGRASAELEATPAPRSVDEIDLADDSGELSPEELHEHALHLLAHGRAVEALRLCLLACDREPGHAEYQASAVWIRAQLPQPDLTVLELDLGEILVQHGDCVSARFYRGVLRRRLGNEPAAREDFEEILALDPDNAAARHELSQLVRGASA